MGEFATYPNGHKFSVFNRSNWPDYFVREVAEWVRARVGIDWPYHFYLKRAVRPDYWRGRAYGSVEANMSIDRRCPCRETKDRRFKWAPVHKFNSALDVFVYLMAHEMHHATKENKAWFKPKTPGGRRREAEAEYRTGQYAMQTVEAFRAEWPAIRGRLLKRLRAERSRAEKRFNLEAVRKELAKDNSNAAKQGHAIAKMDEWHDRMQHADRMYRKWKRKLSALQAAEKRKVKAAAKKG